VARVGDRLRVVVEVAPGARPEDDPSVVVRLERADLVVVDKPGGMPSAPLRPGEVGTLANVLVHRYPEMAGIGYEPREPGLIHRLDTGTSGLMVAARSAEAFDGLVMALRAGNIDKRYLAVVAARDLPGEGLIDEPLVPAGARGQRVVTTSAESSGAQPARTTWRKRRTAGPWALLEVSAPHAYRHQIRAHLAWLGHPMAGDTLYGGADAGLAAGRHALHASYVAWAGADGRGAFAVESPLPDDLAVLLRT
jgi:23S rRNA pseudouridine1911/1915/1917 synthase